VVGERRAPQEGGATTSVESGPATEIAARRQRLRSIQASLVST